MSDPNRIPQVLKRLEQVWHEHPNWRLGQLIVTATRLSGRDVVCPAVSTLKDHDILKGIEALTSLKGVNEPAPWPRTDLSQLETREIVSRYLNGGLDELDVCIALEKRPPSRSAMKLVLDAYRRGDCRPYFTATLLGYCGDRTAYSTVREILLSASDEFIPGPAAVAMARIAGPDSLKDLTEILWTTDVYYHRCLGVACALATLRTPEAVSALLDAILADKISPSMGGMLLGMASSDECLLLDLLDSKDKHRKMLAIEIMSSWLICVDNKQPLDKIPEPVLKPSSTLQKAFHRLLSDKSISIEPKTRAALCAWLQTPVIVRRLKASDAATYQHIRQCALKDVPQFVGPLAEQEALSNLSELRSRMKRYEAEGTYLFGCFYKGECAGVAALSRKQNPKYAHKVFFWGLYILPSYRGRSLGRHLMESRIEFARNLPGVRFATLQVTTTNEPARILHQRFGFISCGIEPHALHLDGKFYDFELMQLDLSQGI